MILLWILIVLGYLATGYIFLISRIRNDDFSESVAMSIAYGFVISLALAFVFLFVQVIGGELTKDSKEVTYSQKLVSMSDGAGLHGEIRGGIFLTRGYVNDTQNFSYYIQNQNGSYSLQKKDVAWSTIWQDVEAKDARVDIVDKHTTCRESWFIVCDIDKSLKIEFVHAHFHIPKGSIQEEFNLDTE